MSIRLSVFELREIWEARAFASEGGVAVHRNFNVTPHRGGARIRGDRETWHIFSSDREALVRVDRAVGLKRSWIPPMDVLGIYRFDYFKRRPLLEVLAGAGITLGEEAS